MRNVGLLTLLLLAFSPWLHGQERDPGRDVWISANTYPTTVQGCLLSSTFRYMVAAQDGAIYNLAGDTARLRPYVGHRVEVSGKPTVRSFSTTEENMASSVEEIPVLAVKSVKELSKSCN